MVAPLLDQLAEELQGVVKISKLNVDDFPAVAGRYSVMNIPTLLLFKEGKEVDRIVGVMPKEELSKRFNRLRG
jgi:thioredoxin 1